MATLKLIICLDVEVNNVMDPVVALLEKTYMQKMITARDNGVVASRKAPKSDKRAHLVSAVRNILNTYHEFQKAISPEAIGKREGRMDAQMKLFELILRTVLSNPFYRLMTSEKYVSAVSDKVAYYSTVQAYRKFPSDQKRNDKFMSWCRARVSGAHRAIDGPRHEEVSSVSWRVIVPPQRYGW